MGDLTSSGPSYTWAQDVEPKQAHGMSYGLPNKLRGPSILNTETGLDKKIRSGSSPNELQTMQSHIFIHKGLARIQPNKITSFSKGDIQRWGDGEGDTKATSLDKHDMHVYSRNRDKAISAPSREDTTRENELLEATMAEFEDEFDAEGSDDKTEEHQGDDVKDDTDAGLLRLFEEGGNDDEPQPGKVNKEATATSVNESQFETYNHSRENRSMDVVNIGGRPIEWKAVEEFLHKMKLQLVPSAIDNNEMGGSKTSRRKGGARELHNLQVRINYNKQPGERGSPSLK
ncbi:hypothetical protein PanWU01x14_317300 [Parasponia andersonii]|uniref:Uncharacterized protein n=1 Tax=Parasponia andersonii TaxID=3476 RepID=A0A2P5AMQ1_PARAD|nr:hypothetical protein PanWU01x14_317300 [Parasponia andersonii]